MSNSRQRAGGPHVRAVAVGFSSGYRWRAHRSEWGQLVRASPGMIRVRIGDAHWVVPPHQGVWIPHDTPHEVEMSGKGVLQRVYVERSTARSLASTPGVVSISPLLRELLRRVLRQGTLDRAIRRERHLIDIMLDEFSAERAAPLELPMPSDPRARRAAERMREDPPTPGSRSALSREAHASTRTLERLFRAETGLSLGTWQQRARLMRAMSMLADGASVTAAGVASGYSSTSAFVAAFRHATGITPGRYFRRRESPDSRSGPEAPAASSVLRGSAPTTARRPQQK